MNYLLRTVDTELDDLMVSAPAIALDGAKGVGKTGTASRRASQTWFLDEPGNRERMRADFSLTGVAPSGTILIDEWQQLPQVWDSVRRRVDDGAPAGRFLLTGSASPSSAAGTHSGAGRIMSLRMRPMGLHERGICEPTVSLKALMNETQGDITGSTSFGLADYVKAIIESGFPGARNLNPRGKRAFLDSYLSRVIDRDLPDLGYEARRPDTLLRWLRAYAAASSTTTTYSRLLDATTAGDGTQPAKSTTITYRDHLSQIFLVDPVPGWLPVDNVMAQLRQSPKHQLADPALAARLLGHTEQSLLAPRGAAMLGPLFESLVTLGVRIMAQAAEASVRHLRTQAGEHEVDLIVEADDWRILAIEVKLASSVSDSDVKHLLWLRERMPDSIIDLAVVNTGAHAYRRPDGIAVIPLALLGP